MKPIFGFMENSRNEMYFHNVGIKRIKSVNWFNEFDLQYV